MADYVIFVDSACDVRPDVLDKWGVKYCELSFMFADEGIQYNNYDMSIDEFYGKIREGGQAMTSGVNSETFKEAFKPVLEAGNDILYIGFSSGLSSTYNNACLAASELMEEFPDRKIKTVDSLSASTGYGMLVYLTVNRKNEGATLEEAAGFAEDKKLRINHWFTVDDIKYLRKGGRIGAAAAKVASTIGIKPVLHMDDEGHLIFRYIVRGKKAAAKALCNEYAKRVVDKSAPVYIVHADGMEDVKRIEEVFIKQLGVKFSVIEDEGPVIGGHTGPGTVGIFFEGAGR